MNAETSHNPWTEESNIWGNLSSPFTANNNNATLTAFDWNEIHWLNSQPQEEEASAPSRFAAVIENNPFSQKLKEASSF